MKRVWRRAHLLAVTTLLVFVCALLNGWSSDAQQQAARTSLFTTLATQFMILHLKNHSQLHEVNASHPPTIAPSMPAHLNAAEQKSHLKVKIAQAQVVHDARLFEHFQAKLAVLRRKSAAIEKAEAQKLAKDDIVLQRKKKAVDKIRAVDASFKQTMQSKRRQVDHEDGITTKAQHLSRQSKLDLAAARVAEEQGGDEMAEERKMHKNDPMRPATLAQAKQMLRQAHREEAAAHKEARASTALFARAMHEHDTLSKLSAKQEDASRAINAAVAAEGKAKRAMQRHRASFESRLDALRSTETLINQEMTTTSIQTQVDKLHIQHEKAKLHGMIVKSVDRHTPTGKNAAGKLLAANSSPGSKQAQAAAEGKRKAKARSAQSKTERPARSKVHEALAPVQQPSKAETKKLQAYIAKRDQMLQPGIQSSRPETPSYSKLRQFIRSRDKMLEATNADLPPDNLKAALPLQFGA